MTIIDITIMYYIMITSMIAISSYYYVFVSIYIICYYLFVRVLLSMAQPEAKLSQRLFRLRAAEGA